MTLDLRVHDWKRSKSGKAVLRRTLPYVRLHQAGESAIFVQGGRYYTDDGKEVAKVPAWVTEQLKAVSDPVKKEIGLVNSSSDKLS